MRVEQDSYGPVSIEDDLLYGVQTWRCLQNLTCSSYKLGAFPELVQALAIVKMAAAQANLKAGIIDQSVASLISGACKKILDYDAVLIGGYHKQFAVDMLHGGGSIAFNQNINEVIANIANLEAGGKAGDYAPVSPKSHVNASQSTADSCSTAFRLAVMSTAKALISACNLCDIQLDQLTERFVGTETVARTCLQDAMLVDATTIFGAWGALLRRRADHIEQTTGALRAVNLGGTVIGTGEGADPKYRDCVVACLSDLTDLPLILRPNLYDAAQNIDDLGEVSCSIELLAQSLIKVASDLRLLSSGPQNGFGELTLPAVQDGSSFFKGKVNPVVPETIMQACFHVIGSQTASRKALEHGELNLNVFESGAVFHILESLKILADSVTLLNSKCLSDLSINVDRCKQMVQNLHLSKSDLVHNNV